jgi:hypothetical protein
VDATKSAEREKAEEAEKIMEKSGER